MDKWIILHGAESNIEYIINPDKIISINFDSKNSGSRVVTVKNDEYSCLYLDETPDEILAMLKEPDTDLRQAAKEVVDAYSNNNVDKQEFCDLIYKLKNVLEKP
jgi:hypothetical protein